MKLAGIIYLQEISQDRIESRNLTIFRKLCGDHAFKNVVLVTTKWKRVDEIIGAERENELKHAFWNVMVRHGSRMIRFDDSHTSAEQIVLTILDTKRDTEVYLRIQMELVDLQKYLPQTDAGRFVSVDLQMELSKSKRDLASLRGLLDVEEDPALRKEYEATQQSIRDIQTQIQQMKLPLARRIQDLLRSLLIEERYFSFC